MLVIWQYKASWVNLLDSLESWTYSEQSPLHIELTLARYSYELLQKKWLNSFYFCLYFNGRKMEEAKAITDRLTMTVTDLLTDRLDWIDKAFFQGGWRGSYNDGRGTKMIYPFHCLPIATYHKSLSEIKVVWPTTNHCLPFAETMKLLRSPLFPPQLKRSR